MKCIKAMHRGRQQVEIKVGDFVKRPSRNSSRAIEIEAKRSGLPRSSQGMRALDPLPI